MTHGEDLDSTEHQPIKYGVTLGEGLVKAQKTQKLNAIHKDHGTFVSAGKESME